MHKTPSDLAQYRVGAVVLTDYSGRHTTHRIAERIDNVSGCQSGTMVRVKPPVPKSGGPDAWLDVAWFKVERG